MRGAAGCADITTRANLQLRGMTLGEADHIFMGLPEVGLSSVSTGAPLELRPFPPASSCADPRANRQRPESDKW